MNTATLTRRPAHARKLRAADRRLVRLYQELLAEWADARDADDTEAINAYDQALIIVGSAARQVHQLHQEC